MQNLLTLTEEKLKSKIKDLYFKKFNYFGDKIDFCITQNLGILGEINLLWAEAKNGKDSCLYESFIQLILTIGKYRYNTQQTPKFLGAFDAEKFAFLPYSSIQEVFYQNDIDWSVTPSNHKTPQFLSLLTQLKPTIEQEMIIFSYESQSKELTSFITSNLTTDEISKYEIDKNNFVSVYFKWVEVVKPTLRADWEEMKKKYNVIDADFYLADLLSSENTTITERLRIVLQGDYYRVRHMIGNDEFYKETSFDDNQEKYNLFWSVYKRPPRKEFWDYILERRDRLVAQDVRERKGAFFTPKIWVQKSQEYLAKALGEDWQEEYYIWDCAGGTGNLLSGLSNPRKIFCSTLDQADVDVIKERIANGANLFENHIFQFDFLNDEFFDTPMGGGVIASKLPKALQEIIKDEKKRQKLVIYINPPYAESASATTATKKSDNKNKTNVSNTTRISELWMKDMGKSIRELYVQFFVRIIKEIGGCVLATFSTLKYINASNFVAFRKIFKGDFLGGFITPSETFDNVKEGFPIGFLIWNTHSKKKIQDINLDVFNKQGTRIGSKFFYPSYDTETINQWIKKYAEYNTLYEISAMCCKGTDFQNSKYVNINFWNYLKGVGNAKGVTKFRLSKNNLIVSFVYFSVRHAIKATWINDRDQFYAPNSLWEEDREFQSDCFAFALFHGQNKISSQNGINYFIPFTEHEVGAKSAFESDFMTRFINGKVEFYNMNNSLYKNKSSKLEFSLQAKAVFNAGREIFIHYHVQASNTKSYNVNASLYDIKEFFQGRDNRSGDMNDIKQAKDTRYKELMAVLGETLGELAKKLEPKIYEYGFLKE